MGIVINKDGVILSEGGDILVAGSFCTFNASGDVFCMSGSSGSIYAGGDISCVTSHYVKQIAAYDNAELSLPSPRCSYCGSCGGEDAYHPGTCANCGAIL